MKAWTPPDQDEQTPKHKFVLVKGIIQETSEVNISLQASIGRQIVSNTVICIWTIRVELIFLFFLSWKCTCGEGQAPPLFHLLIWIVSQDLAPECGPEFGPNLLVFKCFLGFQHLHHAPDLASNAV